ncbi:MAG: lamin tail domain-containing protein, partial [Bacteroidota bacterium]
MRHVSVLIALAAFSLLLFPAGAPAQIATHVVISEVYGGGGNTSAYWKQDFVELYNPTSSPITMTGWSIQYQSATGTGPFTLISTFSGTIPADGFFLISCSQGGGGTADIPTPDATLSPALLLSATNGKVVLVNDGVGIDLPTDPTVVDFVGYGTANKYEGSGAAPGLSNTTSAERKAQSTSTASSMGWGGADTLQGNGWDTNNNNGDFVIRGATAGLFPDPQNTSSPTEIPPTPSNSAPIIAFLPRFPFVAEVGGRDTISAGITDVDGTVTGAKLNVRVNGGAYDSSITMTPFGSTYVGVIPPSKHVAAGDLVEYFITAVDDDGAYASTQDALKGYFTGDAPVSSIKGNPIAGIVGYGARINGTLNVRTNTFSNGQGYIQDGTGGMQLFLTGGLPPFDPGKNVKVQGSMLAFNGSYELTDPSFAFVDTSLGTTALTPEVITLPTTQTAGFLSEGKLVQINGMSTASTGSFAAPASYLYYEADTDTITLRCESSGGLNSLVGNGIPTTPVNVIGILSYSNGFQRIKPRRAEDLGLTASTSYAVASGPWSAPATWQGGVVPDATRDAVINTLNVTVTIDISNAECRNLTLVGTGSASNSGPVLAFDPTGARQLTVQGDVSITGGSGGGSGDRGGRPQLTSNGNTAAVLIVKGDIYTTPSNSVSNGNAGLNMNEGAVKLTGATSDTLKLGATCRMGALEIGDGFTAKTVVTAPSTNTTISITSLRVKAGSTFWIGTSGNTQTVRIGNYSSTGIPVLSGGVTVEPGAALRVLASTAGSVSHDLNIDDGGITNDGTIDFAASTLAGAELATSTYFTAFGGIPVGTGGHTMTVAGTGTQEFAGVTVDSNTTLVLQKDMPIASGYRMILRRAVLSETAGNTVIGEVEVSRTVAASTPENFGNTGFTLNALGGAPGVTVLKRYTGSPVVQGSSQSIARYFD